MLACPPSRINLTAADLASFERRWNARQAARRETGNVRFGQGAARQTRLAFVPAAANVGRQRADSCSSKATICDTEEEDPSIHSNAASPAQRLELPSLAITSNSPRSISSLVERPSPQKRGQPGPARSPRGLPAELDFPIYEDPPIVHAFVESRHFQPNARPAPNHPQIPTINQPSLDPGAPVFVPRTRFGSTASTSTDNHLGILRLDSHILAFERNQSTADLRVRSSFERNTQTSSRGTESHAISSSSRPTAGARQQFRNGVSRRSRSFNTSDLDLPVSLVPTDAPQNRRRSRTTEQNAALQRPLLGLDRYPALRPPTAAFASRRNSGSQRQVVFPHRRSSRQHLVEFERSRRSQGQQNRPTHLAVPLDNGRRPVSPAVSTSSHSTPNLLQPPSAPYVHTRSSSLSSSRNDIPNIGEVPAHRSRKRATAASESSSLIDEILLQRDSPLDRIVQKYAQHPTRPRSVGHSFERPPGSRARPSLLNGNPFGGEYDDFQDRLDEFWKEGIATRPVSKQVEGEPSSQTPHKRNATIEDPVALALALPSPEVPSSPAIRSSPVVRSSPQLPSTPILRSGPSSPLSSSALQSQSSAAKSHHSAASLTPSTQSLTAAVTPRVPVYNDSRPRLQQPQTPADIARSTRRGRSNTASTSQSAVQPSPTLAPPERHPHRHTFPSATRQQQPPVTVGMTPVRSAAVETASAIRRDSLMGRLGQRSIDLIENDIEGDLDGLEEDRRVWMHRHEDGSLDVTPPKEGRFERYLS